MVHHLTAPPVVKGQRYRMTFEEFLERIPDNWQAEWVDGEVYVFMATDVRHARILGFFYGLVSQFVALFDLGEVFFPTFAVHLRGDRSYREPDVFVVLSEHRNRIRDDGLHGPPDLVVEGISDGDPDRDRIDKRREYEAAGVPEYLMIDPREGQEDVTYLRLDTEGRYQRVMPDELGRYHSAVLPGFWFDPEWFRRDPLPNIVDTIRSIVPDSYAHRILGGRMPRDSNGGG
jgi:Uma2 family endonuclease